MEDSKIAWTDIEQLVPWQEPWPANVWLGVTAEDQQRAEERIPILLRHPAAVRFVSYEPALGPVDFSQWLGGLSWVIVGGESDPKRARSTSRGHERARPFDLA